MKAILLGLVVLAGCMVGDSGGPGTGDGDGTTEGGSTGGTGTGGGTADMLIDAGTGGMMAGPPCTGAAYDPCSDNTQCNSGNCRLFSSSSLQVCTTTCTPGDNTTCPQQNGQPAQCNNMGICKPIAANVCTR